MNTPPPSRLPPPEAIAIPRWATFPTQPAHPDWAESSVATVTFYHTEMEAWISAIRLIVPPAPGLQTARIVSVFAGVFVVGALGVLLGRLLMRPFGRLVSATEHIGRGDRPTPIPLEGPRDVMNVISSFNAMSQKVSQSTDYQIGLLHSLGHDLTTPLSAAQRALSEVGPDAAREKIERNLEQAQDILAAIVSFSRAVIREGEIERTDLVTLAEAVVEDQVRPGAKITRPLSETLLVDVRCNAIERAIGNLVENALKHAGSASVSFNQSGNEAVLLVEDDGPGVPEDQLEAVFVPFYRLNGDRPGSGLGLAIARTIVVDHGGSVHLRNRAEGGLRAELRLPLHR